MNFKNVVLIVAGCFILWGCKKFEDDPFISLKTVDRRLQGTWVIDRVNVNGSDVTSAYNDSLNGQLLSDFRIEIGKSDEKFIGVIKSHRSATFRSYFGQTKSRIFWTSWSLMSGLHENPDTLNLKVFNHLLIKTYSIRRLYS